MAFARSIESMGGWEETHAVAMDSLSDGGADTLNFTLNLKSSVDPARP